MGRSLKGPFIDQKLPMKIDAMNDSGQKDQSKLGQENLLSHQILWVIHFLYTTVKILLAFTSQKIWWVTN